MYPAGSHSPITTQHGTLRPQGLPRQRMLRRLYRSTNGGETWNDITDFFKGRGSEPFGWTVISMRSPYHLVHQTSCLKHAGDSWWVWKSSQIFWTWIILQDLVFFSNRAEVGATLGQGFLVWVLFGMGQLSMVGRENPWFGGFIESKIWTLFWEFGTEPNSAPIRWGKSFMAALKN